MNVVRKQPPAQRSAPGVGAAGVAKAVAAGKPPAEAAKEYETVVLVLQGGGALGSYQCGVYESLVEAGIEPDWFAGISIGAINAAIIAGNAPADRVSRLREFWCEVSRPALPLPVPLLDWQRQCVDALPKSPWTLAAADALGALSALWYGQDGFFVPRVPPPFTPSKQGPSVLSFYNTAPLKRTLERLVDFERLNHASVRFCVGAVNVRTGNFAYFDNRQTRIRVEHVLASGALPPAFPAVEIDGEFYWDGGVVSNTPLEYVIDVNPRRDALVFQVDLWNARGALPHSLADVLERQKDIQYSSRTRHGTDNVAQRQRLRLALGQLMRQLPGERFPDELAAAFEPWTCTKVLNIVHLIYRAKGYEEQYKDYAFGPLMMAEHWAAGLADMRATLSHPAYFAKPSPDVGVATHDVHR